MQSKIGNALQFVSNQVLNKDPTHNHLWHTSPTVSCSSDPCRHLRRGLERSWPENPTPCTRTDPFAVEQRHVHHKHDADHRHRMIHDSYVYGYGCTRGEADPRLSWMHCFHFEITKTRGSEVISSAARHVNRTLKCHVCYKTRWNQWIYNTCRVFTYTDIF